MVLLLLAACAEPAGDDSAPTSAPPSSCPSPSSELGFESLPFPLDTTEDTAEQQMHAPLVLADLDGDGDDDLVVGRRNDGVWLLPNDGGRFGEPLLLLPMARTSTIASADVDGDRDLDLLAATTEGAAALLRNDGRGSFATDAAPPFEPTGGSVRHVALGDAEGDGDLDLAVTGGGPDALLLNDGAGIFTDVSERLVGPDGLGWMGLWLDVDADGDLDLYSINAEQATAGPSRLLLNDGAGEFSDATTSCGCGEQGSPMGGSVGDVNEDGLPDILLANNGPTALLLNLGGATFAEAAAAYGAALQSGAGSMSFGSAWWDADFDGDEDAFLSFGPLTPNGSDPLQPPEQADHFLLREGDAFVEVAAELELDDERVGRGVSVGLINDDAALDLVWLNLGEASEARTGACMGGGALVVDLDRPTGNRFGVGAHVELELSDGRTLHRWVTGAAGWGGAMHPRAHFGLGGARALRVRVNWGWGAPPTEMDVPADAWRLTVSDDA